MPKDGNDGRRFWLGEEELVWPTWVRRVGGRASSLVRIETDSSEECMLD